VLYFETSFLAPLILPESTSAKITAFVRKLPVVELALSDWTRIEFSSLIARKVRTRELTAEAAEQADTRFEIMAGDAFAVFLPDANDFGLAKRYLGKFETGLRAGDALHLAIAANRHARAIYSLDRKLMMAGKILDLPVRMGIRAK
jgi:predicted nucleic acid-binding protein